jgi:hypothetical protein
VQVKTFHAMEQIDCFHLAFFLRKPFVVAVLWRPVLKLEDLSRSE